MIKVNETIKKLRKEYGLSQEQLGRAIFIEGSAISQYESGKRTPSIETLESIANVFGYTLDLNLVEKKEQKKDLNFYQEKSVTEILSMDNIDLTEYIFITQDDKMIACICNMLPDMLKHIPLDSLKNILLETISTTDRLTIYFKLNNMHRRVEQAMTDFIDYINYHLSELSNIENTVRDKIHYLEIDVEKSNEGYFYFLDVRALDKNKNDLNLSPEVLHGDDLPLDNELCNEIGEYFFSFTNPFLVQLKY